MHDQITLVAWRRMLWALDREGRRGLDCGDRMSRMDVRKAVQHQGVDPGCAEYWAATYKQPSFEYDSASGHMALAKARWPLMLGVLWVAYGGNVDAVALEWVRFYHFWAAGIWNAPQRPDQVKSRDEAEREVWLALERGLAAYGRRFGQDGRVAIPKTEWDHLRWVDDGMFQSVGSDAGMAFYDVVIEGDEVKALTGPAILVAASEQSQPIDLSKPSVDELKAAIRAIERRHSAKRDGTTEWYLAELKAHFHPRPIPSLKSGGPLREALLIRQLDGKRGPNRVKKAKAP